MQPRYPNDPTYFNKYNEVIKNIDFNVIIKGRKFIIKPNCKRWYCSEDYIYFYTFAHLKRRFLDR